MTMIFSLKWRRIVGSRWYEQSVRYDLWLSFWTRSRFYPRRRWDRNGAEATAERAVPQGIRRMWEKDNGKNDVKNALNAIGYSYALRLSFRYDRWYSVRYESFRDDCQFGIKFWDDSRFEIPKKFGTTINSKWRRAVASIWPRKYDCRFQMTHGSRGLWISPREPNFFALKFSSWKSGGVFGVSWRKRSKVWLYDFTVENMAILRYGQKFGYAFQDETVESLAIAHRDENG